MTPAHLLGDRANQADESDEAGAPGSRFVEQADHPPLLIVDDEPMMLDILEEALREGGYTAVRAGSGDEAIKALEMRQGGFSALITDVNLGSNMDGWRVARSAREFNRDLPIVYTSGLSGRDWMVEGVPCSIMLQKPFTGPEAVAAVWFLLNGIIE